MGADKAHYCSLYLTKKNTQILGFRPNSRADIPDCIKARNVTFVNLQLMSLNLRDGGKHDLHGSERALCSYPVLRPSESEMLWALLGILWLLCDGDLYFEGLEPTVHPSPLRGLPSLPRKHKQVCVPMVTWRSCLPARVKHMALKGEKYSAAFYVVPL